MSSLNILHITPDFDYACGRSYYVFLLLKYLKKSGNNVLLATNRGDSLERLGDYNIPYVTLKNLNSKNPLYAARSINSLRNLINEFNIGLIHTHHRLSEFIALQTVKLFRRKIRTVFTALSIVSKRYQVEYRSDQIIAVSKSVRKMLTEKFHISNEKIKVIHNFTDTEEIHELELIAEHPKDHGQTFNILTVSRFHYEKNLKVLLKSLKQINDSSLKLFLIGEGLQKEELKRLASEYRLNTEFINPQKNLLEYFFIADLCVLPSSRDPFPNFMLQAGLHKKPFIGADVDGISELIHDGENGLLFESDNAGQLAHKIELLRSNLSLAKHCSENLYKTVINNYTQEFIFPKILDVYRNLTTRKF